MVYIVRCSNAAVTDFYLNIIKRMFENCGEQVSDYSNEVRPEKTDIILVSTVVDFFKTYIKGYRNIVYWMQGIEAEESFLKHGSRLRKLVLDMLTCLAVKNSIGIFYVSGTMQKFIDTKFKLDTAGRSFIMPCFNTELNKELIHTSGKYDRNIFTYVGSLSRWQCFEETVDFYKSLETSLEDCELRVYTGEREEADKILRAKGINNYSVGYVEPERLNEELSGVKFGFVIRDDIAVNRVATPTKLSSYMAAGVIPVFSDCLRDFYEKTAKLKYVVAVSEERNVPDRLRELCDNKVDINRLEEEYSKMFADYYCIDNYVDKSGEFIKKIIDVKNK